MPRKKQNIQERWNPSTIDKKLMKTKLSHARHYLLSLENSIDKKSILSDLDYGELHSLVEELYTICKIGALAADNAERQAKEQKELKEKGLKN